MPKKDLDVTLKWVGKPDKQLAKLLHELPRRVAKKANRAAVNAGAKPIVKQLRREMPKQSGLTRKAVNKKVKTYGENAVSFIGANRAIQGEYKGRRRIPQYYWHLLIGGTQTHVAQSKSGKQWTIPGFKGNDALATTTTATKDEVAKIMAEKYRQVVEKEAAKA